MQKTSSLVNRSYQVLRILFMRPRRQSLFVICSVIIALAIGVVPALATKATPLSKTRIIVGGESNNPPFSFLNDKGDPAGFSVDLTRAIAKTMGMEVEIRLSLWAKARKDLEAGKIDIILGMFYSEERAEIYDFSPPFVFISNAIFARRDSPPANSISDLRSKEIIVMRGEVMHDYIIKNRLTDRLLVTETPDDALRLLASGKGDYALVAQMLGFYWIKELKLSNITSVGPPLAPFKNCFAVRKGNKILLSRFTEGLNILNQSGEYQKLYETSLGVLEPTSITFGLAVKYAAIVFVPLILLLAVFLLWTLMLRTKVNEKTKELKESAERFRSLVTNIPGIVYRCANDSDWTMLFISHEIDPVSDYPASDFINNAVRSYASIIHPDDRDLVDLAVQKGVNEKAAYTMEYRICRADGHIRWVHEQGQGVFAPNGNLLWLDGVILDISAHKQAEAALRETEEQYRMLVENASDIVYRTNENGYFTFVNSALFRIVGYTEDEIIGKHYKMVIRPDKFKEAITFFANQLIKKIPNTHYEFPIITKDGHEKWLEQNMQLVMQDNQVTGFQAVARDITGRKKAEKALRESEEKYRWVMDNINDLITVTDINLRFTYISPSIMRSHGYTVDEAMNLTLEQFMTPESLQLLLSVFEEEMKLEADGHSEAGKIIILEVEEYKKDGSTIWLESSMSAQRDKENKPIGILTVSRDITERKRAEEALQESEKKYRLIFDNTPLGHFFFDEKGVIVECNNNFINIIGSTREALIGLNMLNLPDKNMVLTVREALSGRIGRYEDIYHSVTAKKATPMRALFAPMISKGGEIWGGVGIIEDITERKLAEADKAKLEAQLQQSQKMEAIGTLAGGIAHDFNNILGAIIGYTEMAVEEDQNEIQKQYLQETLSGAERARNLVKQILTFSRQDDHEKKPLDIKVLLQEAVKFLRASIPTTIAIDQYITEESCNIMADPTQMHQIIMNLCTNASHAMKEAGGTLKIELANVDLTKDEIPNHPDLQPGHFVKLTISDTGHGIDPALIQRIFDPFFTTKSVDEGTGLGLSVVYGIVKSHGGIINVYSEPDKGAAFHVYLPRITYGEDMKVDRRKPVTGGTERILFVDDEPALVDLGTRMLSSLGYEVESVLSSVEALDLFHTKPESFDLVITDMTLPKMTGIDLSRNLLKIRPNIPIILCSGIKDPDTEAQVKSMGIKAYIMKPLTKRELAGVMREVLDGRE